MTSTFAERLELAERACRPERIGVVRSVVGLSLDVAGVEAAVGDLVTVEAPEGQVTAEVVAVQPDGVRCMPLAPVAGLTAQIAAVRAAPSREPSSIAP